VIPADLGAELAAAIAREVAAGRLPASAAGATAAGTWRPAPGGYATSLPFELARRAGEEPAAIAARLGQAILAAPWIASARPTGAGHLTIGVGAAALEAVAVRISSAGPSCARSDVLRGTSVLAPPLPDLAAGASWRAAWRDQAAALTGRLALAAGATAGEAGPGARAAGRQPAGGVPGAAARAPGPPGPGDEPGPSEPPRAGRGVAGAVAWAGADAVRYWLARLPAARAGVLDRPASSALQDGPPIPAQPFAAPPALARELTAVRLACADAAATVRWAAELGWARAAPLPPGQLGHAAQVALLEELSWLAERVAGAARRGQPAELPRYLERLAGAWLDCRESCPALPFGGRAAARDAAAISARLWLAAAARTALSAGLDLIGVGP
jgi:DALR anticodon binding domain